MKRIVLIFLSIIICVATMFSIAFVATSEDWGQNIENTTISEAYIPSETFIDTKMIIPVEQTKFIFSSNSKENKKLLKQVKEKNQKLEELINLAKHDKNLDLSLVYKEYVNLNFQIELYQNHYKQALAEEKRIAEEKRLAAERAEKLRQEAKRQEELKKRAEAAQKTAATKSQTTTVSIKGNYSTARTIWNYLKGLGYNNYVAAGIMGNIMAEVGGQTLNIQPYLYGPGGGYYGICQWSLRYSPSIKGTDLNTQLNYLAKTIRKEINNYGRNYNYNSFLKITNERTAALVFAQAYERCGSGSYGVRQSNATKAYNYFVG